MSLYQDIFVKARRIAVVGAHPENWRPAFYVPDYLYRAGYVILPVNPMFEGKSLWGQPIRASLQDLGEIPDMVVVFRRSEALPELLPALLECKAKMIWFQSGIRHEAVAETLREAGRVVVQDACTMVEHRRLNLTL